MFLALFCSFASLISVSMETGVALCSFCFGQIDANWGFFSLLSTFFGIKGKVGARAGTCREAWSSWSGGSLP